MCGPTGNFQLLSTLITTLILFTQPSPHYVITETFNHSYHMSIFHPSCGFVWNIRFLHLFPSKNATAEIVTYSFTNLPLCSLSSSVELHGCQQHRDGVSGALCGGLWEKLLRGRQQPRRDRVHHGRRALRGGGQRDFQLPSRPRVRASEQHRAAGAEARLAAHTQGKHPGVLSTHLVLLILLCIHRFCSLYILLMFLSPEKPLHFFL